MATAATTLISVLTQNLVSACWNEVQPEIFTQYIASQWCQRRRDTLRLPGRARQRVDNLENGFRIRRHIEQNILMWSSHFWGVNYCVVWIMRSSARVHFNDSRYCWFQSKLTHICFTFNICRYILVWYSLGGLKFNWEQGKGIVGYLQPWAQTLKSLCRGKNDVSIVSICRQIGGGVIHYERLGEAGAQTNQAISLGYQVHIMHLVRLKKDGRDLWNSRCLLMGLVLTRLVALDLTCTCSSIWEGKKIPESCNWNWRGWERV
jgi:hypothetical protein